MFPIVMFLYVLIGFNVALIACDEIEDAGHLAMVVMLWPVVLFIAGWVGCVMLTDKEEDDGEEREEQG